jgi:hypothetical protein
MALSTWQLLAAGGRLGNNPLRFSNGCGCLYLARFKIIRQPER